MATIISKPGSIAMSGNIKDIIVDSSTEINFVIQEVGGSTILEETYQPDANNKITIRLRDLLPSLLSLQLPTSDVFEQTNAVKNYNFIVEGTAVPTKVVFGGVDADADPEVFLKGNWLTWQPQQKKVKFNDPEWLSYHAVVTAVVKVKAYFKDKDPETITLASLPSGKTYSLNMNFGYLSGKFTGQPVYFDVWNEDTVGTQLAFVQRFVLFSDYFEHEDLFVVDNSLGGLDTFRFTGKKEDINDFEIESALFDEYTMDYDVEFEKYYKKNTGYFLDDRYRIWTQEFFNSLNRYYCADTGYQSITVSKPKAKSVQGDITTYNYDFEFALSRQTKYLNLSRVNELPTEVQIVDPDSELFFLAPRLSEFPSAILNSQLLIPVQVPFTEKWEVTNYGAIRTNILSEVAAMGFVSGDEVASHVDLSAYALVEDLHEHTNKAFLDTLALDGNYLESNNGEVWVANSDRLGNLAASNYWTKQELINDALYLKVGADKVKAGYADLAYDSERLGNILAADHWNKFNSDIASKSWTMYDAIVHRDFVTSAFAPGIIGGVGAKIDQSGHCEMKSLDLREFLRTPELIKNQVRVAGNQFWFTDPGLIQDVSGTGPYTLTLKIEEGDGVSFKVDDILIGIFNHDTGFETCYLDVVSVDLENNQVVVNSRNGISPRKFMQLARKGNETNTDRQTSVFVDGLNGFVRVLGGVNDHNTTFNNIIAQLGYLNMHSPVFGDMEKGLYVKDFGYFENVRVSGEIHVTGGNAETQTGAQDKADAAEAAATAVASTAQSKADSAYNLADLKITEADAVTITHREIKAPYIATLGLKVGDEILMGENAVISWEKVIGTENVETTSGAQAKVDALIIGGENLIKNSDFGHDFDDWRAWEGNPSVSNNICTCSGSGTVVGILPHYYIDLKKDQKYTLSFEARSDNDFRLNYMYWMRSDAGNSGISQSIQLTTEWNKYIITDTCPFTSSLGSVMISGLAGGVFKSFQIRNVKFELGEKSTDWSAHLSDYKKDATNKADAAEASASALAGTAQSKADSAYSLAESKTDAWVTTITNNTVTSAFIQALSLKVGDEIQMGPNAIIAWDKVTGTENVETTSGAQAKVDALVVGGENLLDNSNFSDGFTGWGTWGSPTISEPADKGRRIVKYGYTNGFGAITPRFAAKQGVKYMVSFDAASMYSTSSLNYMYIMKSSGNVSLPGVLIDGGTTQYKRYAFSFISPVTEDISIMFAKVGLGLNDEGFKINNVKIEIGDKATAWTPSLNDVDTNVTSISQNVIATTTVIAESLKVKAANIIDQLTAAQINFDNAVGNNVTLSGKFISNSQTLGAGNLVIDGAHMYRSDLDNDSATFSINWYGYNNGTSRYRDFTVYDGKAQYPLLSCYGKLKKVKVGTSALPDAVNLEVYGDLDVDGAIHWGTPSDKSLKKRIKTIGNPLKALRKTRPVTFYYKEGEQILHRGFIAQEIQEVFPEFVSKRKDGKLRINTIEMIAQNTAGILQNDTRITLLKKEVEYLKSKLKKHGITY